MIGSIIGSLIAVAMAFAPVAEGEYIENNAVTSAENKIVLNNAYYDPNGEYGTEGNKIYNYSSIVFLNPSSSSPWSYSTTTGANPANFQIGIYQTEEEAQQHVTSWDVYVGGEFDQTITAEVSYQGSYVVGWLNGLYSFFTNANGSYIWFFDHQESTPEEVNIVGDIAQGLTGGIVPVAQGLGSGFQDLMKNIFLVGHVDATTNEWVADGLSTFGIVSICFAGLALALGLSRWVVNFVGSLGSRDR